MDKANAIITNTDKKPQIFALENLHFTTKSIYGTQKNIETMVIYEDILVILNFKNQKAQKGLEVRHIYNKTNTLIVLIMNFKINFHSKVN